ncbi:MAG TPA: hypothetical protein VIT44_13060 [Cyclobacteriaceae bacterium]
MQKRFLLSLLLLSGTLTVSAQDPQFYNYYTLAKEAYQKKDYEANYTNLKEANRLHPYHQIIQYRLGIAAALTNRPEEAIGYLKKAILADASLKLKDNDDLTVIKNRKDFQDLLVLQEKLSSPVIQSDTAFVLKDRTLHTEGIEYNRGNKTFYLGSIHKRKVVQVNEKGEVSDFCSSAFEGMTSVFGLKVDAKKNVLWVCSSPMPEMEDYDSTLRSAVFKFDLKTGKLLKKYFLENGKPEGTFGDLILTQKGEVIVSDSRTNTIYKVNEAANQLESIFSSKEFWNIQGMAFSPDEKYLFVSDYIKGLFIVNMATKEIKQLENLTESSLKGVDGLYFYKNSLITIQNGITPFRVTRYTLNKEFTALTRFEIIDRAHPAFGEPTLGVLVGQSLYYIANSQWGGYEEGKQKSPDLLQDIVILKAKIEINRSSR